MQFSFKALRQSGESYEGLREAPDKFSLSRDLKAEGETIVFAKEVKPHSFSINIFGRVKMHDKIIFAKNLGAMIEAGLSVSRALSILERETDKKKFKQTIKEVGDRVSRGEELSAALAAFPQTFSSLFVSMVKAGEQSGAIANAFKLVARQMNDSYELQKKILGALMYPAIIIALIVVIAILMLIFVIPQLTATFKELNVPLPLPTRVILGVSSFLLNHYIIFPAVIIASAAALFFGLRTRIGGRMRDFVLLRLPVFKKIVVQANSARTARTFASLVTSGVDVVRSLEITSEVVQNSYYRDVLDEAKTKIQKGEPISSVFSSHTELYPVFVGEMISVGEETGKLGETLDGVATFYEKEIDQTTKNLSTIIEPVLMIMVGAAVGVFAVSVISPIYSLVNSI
ncbi:MAG: hypothetical protein A2836_02705 [Candidatus Taylorbacteria bacterium RIFCSPHIGHO2_01_FULL_45_63]|uniref:Type II secretion system protein GspF domain-containing protein n=1 Tax=Candidatus Taylorbacteria bacterium RIFCSPHIGHO2_02_FULL_45_35 TaxID=1802311 RepID=A0A1G2MPB5_9BACT|nr:MAG: hypothetical protein A2836_02705 [Candidatus Taylorbacteria bacterium RIFCSPHIGHO2_01_FULL_45_63]OHA25693.1 MAG: hypothetical protein A3D56_00780 [Candidatus Taylorbacteria bacterium RIFCSPHIGHO2_02_FULL_45_35]OHA33968.1 MAG: hypothetical protein A3A22_04135 [Candidatus Taylorbacteria bacterium RIFCSPLOWO2_01_FULL_45_34b]QBM02314.1 putative type II secretion system protein F [uncultured archaeon]